MDKWLEAYGHWPPSYQLMFSVLGLVWLIGLCYLGGIWLQRWSRDVTIWIRGHPAPPIVSPLSEARPVKPRAKTAVPEAQAAEAPDWAFQEDDQQHNEFLHSRIAAGS